MRETKRTGLKGPKVHFVRYDIYVKRWGEPDPSKVRWNVIDGEDVKGVDTIFEEDSAVYFQALSGRLCVRYKHILVDRLFDFCPVELEREIEFKVDTLKVLKV